MQFLNRFRKNTDENIEDKTEQDFYDFSEEIVTEQTSSQTGKVWEHEREIDVSSRRWFWMKSEMEKTLEDYAENGWTLIKQTPVAGSKKYILHFGYNEPTLSEKIRSSPLVKVAVACAILFSCAIIASIQYSIQEARTNYVRNNGVNIRAEPSTNSSIIATLNRHDQISVRETVEGSFILGSDVWYRIRHNGETAYIHSSLVINELPTAIPTIDPANIIVPTSPPPQWDCNGNIYNCSYFSSCGEVMSYFNTCSGDPSDLDRDGNGIPCESLCN